MFNFFPNKNFEEKYSEDERESEQSHEDEDMKSLNDKPSFQNKIMINGDDEGERTWFAKLSPEETGYIDFWELNRKVDKAFIKNIRDWQENYHNENGRYNFVDPIHICELEEETEDGIVFNYKLLDGQHRLSAYNELYHKNDKPMLPVIIHKVKNKDEMLTLFEYINNRAFLNMKQLEREREKLESLQKLMDRHWVVNRLRKIGQGLGDRSNGSLSIFGKNRPYINREKFCLKIRDTDCFFKDGVDEILKKLVKINESIKTLPFHRRAPGLKKNSKYAQTSEFLDFYLGYDKDMKWMSEIDKLDDN